MKYIGKLDEDKLVYFKGELVTQEVIITDERISHIKNRHLEDYKKYINLIYKVIEEPDYICLDRNNKETIFMLKCMENKNLQVVIKLQTKRELINRQNSILTFWSIRDRNYEKVLKNNKIIYSKYGRK